MAAGSVIVPPFPSATPSIRAVSENEVRQYWSKPLQLGVKRAEDVGERLADFLRRRHPNKTAECVAAETGISASTIGKWLERASVPGGSAFLRLIAVYGPDFLVAGMGTPPAWLSKAAREEHRARLNAELAALDAEDAP